MSTPDDDFDLEGELENFEQQKETDDKYMKRMEEEAMEEEAAKMAAMNPEELEKYAADKKLDADSRQLQEQLERDAIDDLNDMRKTDKILGPREKRSGVEKNRQAFAGPQVFAGQQVFPGDKYGGKKRTMRKKNRKGTRTTTRTRRQRKNRTRAMRKKARKSRKSNKAR